MALPNTDLIRLHSPDVSFRSLPFIVSVMFSIWRAVTAETRTGLIEMCGLEPI